MFSNKSDPSWSPLYFLSALGAGGMIVTFFMYLLFWVSHPSHPIPVYEDWTSAFVQGSLTDQVLISISISGVAFFTLYHFFLLRWNLAQFKLWKAAGEMEKMAGKNAHTQMLAIPLTLAMSINAGFMAGALFIPGLWSVVEYLFPLAIAGFVLLGIWAMRLYLSFFSHSLSQNKFDKTANNSLAQLLPGFAFAMVSVGLVAPAAMSHNESTVAISILLAFLFIVPSVFISLIKLVLGIGHMLEHGANKSALPTLWVGVPILTTLSITMLRLDHGIAHTLGLSDAATSSVFFLGLVLATQIFLILLGFAVMKRMHYFRSVWNGEEKTPVIYALICPGVALSVSIHFFANKGLVSAGLIEKFGVPYWSLSGAAIIVQIFTAFILFKLVKQLIGVKQAEPVLVMAPGH